MKKQKLSKDLNEGEITKTNLPEDISGGEITKTSLLEDISGGEITKTSLLEDISGGEITKTSLLEDISGGEITKTSLLEDISGGEITKTSLLEDITTAEANKSVLDDAFKKVHDEYKDFKLFIEPNEHSKSPRAKTPPSNETARTTRYNRYIEKKDMLKYIHGGSDGAIFGVWEYMSKNASKEQLENLMLDYKKGKFTEKLYGHFNESLRGETMKEIVASKFQLSLSRRKFNFLYKVKSQTYDPETEKWNRKSISYGDKKNESS